MARAALPPAEPIVCCLHHDARVAASPFPILLVIGQQCMNLLVCFVADRVNLRTEILA